MDFAENKERAEGLMRGFDDRSFMIKPGSGSVMFSAPHCVEQTRGGQPKCAEPQTGVLAEMLHSELNCPIIRKTSNLGDDANFDAASDYKGTLVRYVKENHIKFLVDLHQLAPSRSVMINFGTGNWNNLSDKHLFNLFLSAFTGRNLGRIQIDEPFGACYEFTVSATVHRECGIPCLQIEMNTRLLSPKHDAGSFEAVYGALKESCIRLEEFYARKERL